MRLNLFSISEDALMKDALAKIEENQHGFILTIATSKYDIVPLNLFIYPLSHAHMGFWGYHL